MHVAKRVAKHMATSTCHALQVRAAGFGVMLYAFDGYGLRFACATRFRVLSSEMDIRRFRFG